MWCCKFQTAPLQKCWCEELSYNLFPIFDFRCSCGKNKIDKPLKLQKQAVKFFLREKKRTTIEVYFKELNFLALIWGYWITSGYVYKAVNDLVPFCETSYYIHRSSANRNVLTTIWRKEWKFGIRYIFDSKKNSKTPCLSHHIFFLAECLWQGLTCT